VDQLDFKTINTQRVTDVVYQLMRESIIERKLKPGQKLSPEALATQLGVSRTPLREAFRILESEGFSVCAEAADAAAAVEAAFSERPRICLLDVDMPGGGISAAATITDRLPDTTVVMFTDSDNPIQLMAALRAGASGYLPKDTHAHSLANSLRAVARGEAALPRHLVSLLIEELRGSDRRSLQSGGGLSINLTPREWDTLELLDKGLSAVQIADHLQISRVTARRHIANVVRKLKVTDRGAAVRAYRDNTPA
jgi:two-component system, NarL family, nitrate/nitrite response regulator NarL